ncbi:MAG: glycosyltransferase [Pseudomonadota bacterium]
MSVGIILDVTRTISRAGLGAATGIDRVERRWIEEALKGRWGRARFLARIASGVHVVEEASMASLLAMLDGTAPPPRLDLRGAVSFAKRPEARRIESALRRAAAPPSFADLYANVGHSNLTPASVAAARDLGAARVAVLLHDLIPLEHPEFARPEGAEKMRTRLDAAASADAVIYNSHDTRARAEARMAAPPSGAVAPLGIDAARRAAPSPLTPHGGFVALGTIEPRKNHALLLDVWAALGSAAPTLHVIGRRGWMNEAVFARLDAPPRGVVEHGGLDDAAMVELVAGARALLFPSFAEGYGLPLGEALALGCPVVASDLDALREVGGAAPDYLSPHDAGAWETAVRDYADPGSPARAAQIERMASWAAPTWSDHFAAADRVLAT